MSTSQVSRQLCAGWPARLWLMGAVLAPAAPLAAAPPEFDGVPLRIVTLNLKDGMGSPGSVRYNDFGDFITLQDEDGAGPNRGLAPDIVCFQEVNDNAQGFADVINFRQEHLPLYQFVNATGDGFNRNITLVRPDIQILDSFNLSTPGPRNVVKLELGVPGAAKPLILYNAHFKAGGSSFDQNTRSMEANTIGDNVDFEVNFGGPNFDGEVNVIVAGDLNSNNNFDGTLTDLFFVSLNPLTSSGVVNLLVESLAGRTAGGIQDATFPSSGSRLDYICLDEELAAVFDTQAPFDELSLDERNQMGFVYYSTDDNGQRANGNALATNLPTDHRAVVFDVYLPRDPMIPAIAGEDVDADGDVDAEDLYRWEEAYALTVPPAASPAKDVDCNRNVDPMDGTLVRIAIRSGELGDLTGP